MRVSGVIRPAFTSRPSFHCLQAGIPSSAIFPELPRWWEREDLSPELPKKGLCTPFGGNRGLPTRSIRLENGGREERGDRGPASRAARMGSQAENRKQLLVTVIARYCLLITLSSRSLRIPARAATSTILGFLQKLVDSIRLDTRLQRYNPFVWSTRLQVTRGPSRFHPTTNDCVACPPSFWDLLCC